MTTTRQRSDGVSGPTMAALILAVFTVSVGFGILLPLLPYLVERLLAGEIVSAQISRHTGLLTAVYTLALFLFAPMWGRLSDRRGPRSVLLVGLLGFGATMLIFSFVESLPAVYTERFLSGMFAAAVAPVTVSTIGNFTTTEEARARRLAFVSMSSIAGFLLGPMLGVFLMRLTANFFTITMPSGSVAIPLAATALLAFLVAPVVAFTVPGGTGQDRPNETMETLVNKPVALLPKLLTLTFIVSAVIGVFEVGLALRGKQELGFTPYQTALMFTECSLVMFATQAIMFSPWVKPDTTRWLIAPSLAVLASAMFLVPWVLDFTLMLVVIGAISASAGLLSPILTYWISAKAGRAQGQELGKQTAAASIGVTVGSAAGGLLFNIAAFPGASFVMTAGLAPLGFLLSLGLANLLVPHNLIKISVAPPTTPVGKEANHV